MDLYLYADETSFERPEALDFTVGYGLRFSTKPVDSRGAAEALAELAADPDSKKRHACN